MLRVIRRPLASILTPCSFGASVLSPSASAVRSIVTTTDANAANLQQKPPTTYATKVMASAPELFAVLRQLQVENRVQTGDEDFPECSPAWLNKAVSAIDHRFCTLPPHTQSLFSTFVKDQRKSYRENTIALIPGTAGSGRTTLLQMFATSFDHVANMTSLYLSDVIAYDASDPRLSFGDSSFIKLQYRVLHAATGAPPHAFGRTVLELRRRLGLEAWFAFPNDVLFEAVRKALSMNVRDYILVAVDDAHVSCPTIRAENVGEDLLRLLKMEKEYMNVYSLVIGVAATAHKIEGETNIMGWNPILIHVPNSNIVKDKHGNRIYLLTAGAPNPNPRFEAALHFLRLSFNSHRASEVRNMLRKSAVNARFLADTYHLICGGGLTSVADFDAQFAAFVCPRIDQFLAYCREKHLDPKGLFDDIFLARPGSNIINPLTVAADAVGLCTIVVSHHDKSLLTSAERKGQNIYLYIHPKVFVMLHSAVFAAVSLNSPPLLLVLLAFTRRINAFTMLQTTAAADTLVTDTDTVATSPLAAAPMSSPARCHLHFQSDVALLMLIAILARAADESPRCKNNNTLTDLFPGWKSHVSEEALKDTMVRRMDPAHTSYADMVASHTLAQGDGPLYVEGMPRTTYSFPRVNDSCGPLADPSSAPALLRSMAAHGLIRGALHGLDVRWDVNRQIRGSLTFGLQAIDAVTAERTEAAIVEHRAQRAEWAKAFERTGDEEEAPHEKTASPCDLLKTNIFVHVFVIDGQNDKRLLYTPEPFTVGDTQCFELMISMADLQQRWPMAAHISALDGRDGSGSNSETISELVIEEDDNEEEDYYDDDE